MILELIATPERHDPELLAGYPAHLQINLLPEARSGGWGRRMVEAQLHALRQAGVKGVQLGVRPSNVRAMGFYEHLGLANISKPDHVTYGMTLG